MREPCGDRGGERVRGRESQLVEADNGSVSDGCAKQKVRRASRPLELLSRGVTLTAVLCHLLERKIVYTLFSNEETL